METRLKYRDIDEMSVALGAWLQACEAAAFEQAVDVIDALAGLDEGGCCHSVSAFRYSIWIERRARPPPSACSAPRLFATTRADSSAPVRGCGKSK